MLSFLIKQLINYIFIIIIYYLSITIYYLLLFTYYMENNYKNNL